jgi:hypothetical protein
VETEAYADSWSTYERGPSLVGSLGSSCRQKRFLSCLGCSSKPGTKYYFLTAHFFAFLVPIAQQPGQWAGSRAGSPVYVSLSLPLSPHSSTPFSRVVHVTLQYLEGFVSHAERVCDLNLQFSMIVLSAAAIAFLSGRLFLHTSGVQCTKNCTCTAMQFSS